MSIEDSEILSKILHHRSSCRAFLPTPVAEHVIRQMLSMAQRAPSWCNVQPWQLVITRGPATDRFRNALFAHAQSTGGADGVPPMCSDFAFPSRYNGSYDARRRACAHQLYDSLGILHEDRARRSRQMMRNFCLFDAPHVIVLTTERDLGVYGAVDCGVYVAFLLLAAQSLGLGAIPQAALAGCAPFVRRYFQLPDNRKILLGISFGYCDYAHPVNRFRTSRADMDSIVQWVD